MEARMAQSTINDVGAFTDGNKTNINANFTQLYAGQLDVVSVAANKTLTSADAGRIQLFNIASGATITLPASTGSGYTYYFAVGTSVTSNNDVIQVANASDIIQGVAIIGSSGGTSASVGTASADDTISLNGSTKGGLRGTWVEITDIATNLYRASVHGVGSGVAVTPFSSAV
jgi:hypothetical protein